MLLLCSVLLLSCGEKNHVAEGRWALRFSPEQGTVAIRKDSVLIADNLYASYKLGDKLITAKDYASKKVSKKSFTDKFGKSVLFRVTYTSDTLPTLVQRFYLQPQRDYLLTDFSLESGSELASSYMAPVNVEQMPAVLDAAQDNRALFIPFDNDKWVRFRSHPLGSARLTSYEVTAVFGNEDRRGYVLGSVEHDSWKTAVNVSGSESGTLQSLTCYGGVADELTRDSKPHGALRGKVIKSPLVLLGFFDDWRSGLEEYAAANAVVATPRAWKKSVPFGWNSWGVLQFKLTYQKAMEVSDFFKKHLQKFAGSDSAVYIGLDSGWNRFTEDELKSFVQQCRANGQAAGIYWTPFTDWGKKPERTLKDAPGYSYKDVYLYANGNPQELDGAYALDPTHPAVEEQMKKTSDLFRRCGFEYVKMDFMTHGAMEADRWHNASITTGIQAYSYGMQLLNKYFGDMFINLSISPIFPAQYAQSRRIACDAWNKIKDTEYTMNAVSYGWWIGKVYRYNDADHIVLNDATEGENRARVTSSVITGLYIAGDDFSAEGSKVGKERAVKYLTNGDVNAAAQGISFRPTEGNGAKSESRFTHTDESGNMYYVVFNYSERDTLVSIPLERIGLDGSVQYTAKELWSGAAVDLKSTLRVPAKDVKMVRIAKR